ncbi:hypothetical protein MEN41_16525 [Dolichospermum sp. ST_con]|nr:hypothetical protein [Dolichospermum sp. ST_con]MDD1421914.1 hypothetical protein [Dolichospermum sp. ST_sed1]MDD1427640.1 hypothetical protein [Dolichospermum sp. ST_sed9]MDD1434009.1 hypothetical protein [Dolichospermum sp. ST_sed6]MDD1437632.1 hypothetical protein [Dolichospermum sp. ST_sed10]MDD1440233.1 hypothetical protein [Dolichospermum sp. ST_sed3]MDD1449032.1 hypothetical protein [Dolichospermum sp. ST_sed8]MDD1458270.1 hypothetical protein [Dolichospermum sp. ST_sed7]MDD146304
MNNKAKLLTFATVTLTVFAVTVGTVIAQTKLTSQAKVTINSIGPVKIGMNLPEAAAAANTRLSIGYAGSDSCYSLQTEGELKGVSFMVTKDDVKSRLQYITSDVIARVDVDNPKITTLSGAKIGDTEARIKSLYPGQIKVTPHTYIKGHYLTFIPKNKAEQNYRIVFETDGQRVIRYRAGKLPEVEYIEGCS